MPERIYFTDGKNEVDVPNEEFEGVSSNRVTSSNLVIDYALLSGSLDDLLTSTFSEGANLTFKIELENGIEVFSEPNLTYIGYRILEKSTGGFQEKLTFSKDASNV